MSRPYRLAISESICEQDSSTFGLEPISFLPDEEMEALIREVMEAHGWKTGDDGKTRDTSTPGMEHCFDPEEMEIKTTVTAEQQVERELSGYEENAESINRQAERLLEEARENAEKEASRKLDETRDERRAQFEGLFIEATGRAIKDAAGRMGDVTNIQEATDDDGSYSLQVEVKERA